MRALVSLLALGTVVLGGCSLGDSLTTGSILGSGNTAKPANATGAAAPAPPSNNTPTNRALGVGTVAARAVRCGYNFDAAALKSNYLASEAALGTPVADLAKLERIYDVGFNGVNKAVRDAQTYCTPAKTAAIKKDLNRHLAGDFVPPPPKVAKVDDEGIFGDLWGGQTAEKGPRFGTDDWWDKQRGDTGR